MSARVDVSFVSVVVWCTLCPGWSEMAEGRADGHNRAVQHDDLYHPSTRAAEQRRRRFEKRSRHAA